MLLSFPWRTGLCHIMFAMFSTSIFSTNCIMFAMFMMAIVGFPSFRHLSNCKLRDGQHCKDLVNERYNCDCHQSGLFLLFSVAAN